MIALLQAQYNRARELNVDVIVQNAAAVSVNFSIGLKAEDGYEMSALAVAVEQNVRAYIRSLGVGSDVLLSNVSDVVYHTEGVADHHFLESYGSNREIADSEYAVPGSIVVGSLT